MNPVYLNIKYKHNPHNAQQLMQTLKNWFIGEPQLPTTHILYVLRNVFST